VLFMLTFNLQKALDVFINHRIYMTFVYVSVWGSIENQSWFSDDDDDDDDDIRLSDSDSGYDQKVEEECEYCMVHWLHIHWLMNNSYFRQWITDYI